MKKLFALALSVMLFAGVFAGCGQKAALTVEEAEKRDNVVVASIDGIEISLGDYTYWYRINQMDMEQNAVNSGGYTVATLADFWKSKENGITNAQSLKETSLADAKNYANLLKMATDAGTVMDPAAAEENSGYIDAAVAAMDEDPDKAAQLFLDKYGATPNQMKRIYLGMDLINQYLYGLSESMEVSDDDLMAEYLSNSANYDSVTVRHVLVLCNENMSDEEKEEARRSAEDILEQLNAGADIGELARLYSEDPGSAENNGEYTFGRGEMVTEFEEWAFAAGEGDTGIVQTSYGYHVMLSMPKPGFEKLKDSLRQKVVYDRIDGILNESYENASLQWNENESAINSINTDKRMMEEQSEQS